MPNLIDIHCHLNFPDFDSDRGEVIKRTLDAGMWCISVGADLKTSQESIELAEKHDGIFATVGCHPHYANEDFGLDKYRELAKYPKVVAIGECGLDYNRIKNHDSRIKNLQKDLFKKQIELSIELDKPLMIHCRDSHEDVIDILKSYFVNHNSGLRGNVHFFTGKQKHVEEYLKLGFMFSFTGLITYTKDFDKIIEKLSLEKIMLETDAPFVAPRPWRGQRSEPLHTKEVAKRISEIKNISFEEVAKQTTKNAIDFFGLK